MFTKQRMSTQSCHISLGARFINDVPDYSSITMTVYWSLATKITHREYIHMLKFPAGDLCSEYQGYKAKRIAWLEFGTPFEVAFYL